MKNHFLFLCLFLLCAANIAFGQIPMNTQISIVKAEDERRSDSVLEKLMQNPDAKIRQRAALAAGRIGDEKAVPALVNLLKDNSVEVQTTAAFALGEIESPKAAAAVLEVLNARGNNENLRARATEAAGKIAAANPKDANSSELGKAIVSALEFENGRRSKPNDEIILFGLTAILRTKPAGGERITAKFLDDTDAEIRANALNTLGRLRSKNVNEKARELLARDLDPNVRANAARILGVGEGKSAIDLLLNVATKDVDSRVRVSAIRSLGSLKDMDSGEKLLKYLQKIFSAYLASKIACETTNNSRVGDLCKPEFQDEYLEIAAALGRILPNSNNMIASNIFTTFNEFDKYQSPEVEIALARIAPSKFSELQRNKKDFLKDWRAVNAMMAGIGELANAPDSAEITPVKTFAKSQALAYIRGQLLANQAEDKTLSDALTAYAAFKTDDLTETLRNALLHKDAIVRATVAGIMAEQSPSKENIEALKSAFTKSLLTDKHENDAQLAILDALYKLDKKAAVGTFLIALDAPDYLVRKKAFEILKDKDLQKDFPGVSTSLENALAKKKNQVSPYAEYTGTKLGQILNTNADYSRAVSRKNGAVKAVLTTTKGSFTIDLTPEDAPLTVDNFIKLARTNYFNGVSVHRVVPNFVMQDGDPRGDGNGGPGWQIRCEINMLPFERGAVGMALSGKDTGGSQWFVTHSPQPHLDGGYTVFGKVNETDMKIVDSIVRGDKILSVKIIENSNRKNGRK